MSTAWSTDAGTGTAFGLLGFTWRLQPWYVLCMADSYLGIITRKGLELLVWETEHAERFLQRRVRRDQRLASLCCWALLSEEAAWRVRLLVRLGLHREALKLLNAEALSLGTLWPEAADDELFMSV